jgi:uncharacterized cupin superfamily protein
MGYSIASLESLGDGYGFRKARAALGVTAFGVNWQVFPPGTSGVHHYHDTQDELYLVHRGTAKITVDGEENIVEAGGLVHVEAASTRIVENVGDEDLYVFIVGGKDGYVERDGHLVDPADLAKRQALSRGEMS